MDINKDLRKLERQLEQLVKLTERKLGKQYAALAKEIRHKLSDYASKYDLTYEELNKYGRLEKLQQEIAEITRKHTLPIAREIRKSTRDSVILGYETTLDALGEATGRTLRGVLNPDVINAIEQSPHSGLKLNERLQGRRAEIEQQIRATITQGIYRGEPYKEMAKNLLITLEGDTAKAMRIVRTESHRAVEAGKFQACLRGQAQGVQQMKWWASAFDERTRVHHAWMGHNYAKDNMIPLESEFENPETGGKGLGPGQMNNPSDDINCRCSSLIEIIAVGKQEVEPKKE